MSLAFTDRHLAFMRALQAKLRELSDPESEHRRTFGWTTTYSRAYGSLPTLRFEPHGQVNEIKKEVLEDAGLLDREHYNRAREEKGLPAAKNTASNMFDSYLIKLSAKWKQSLTVTALANKLFSPAGHQIAPPVEALQQIIAAEYGPLSEDIQPIHGGQAAEPQQAEDSGSYWEELQRGGMNESIRG